MFFMWIDSWVALFIQALRGAGIDLFWSDTKMSRIDRKYYSEKAEKSRRTTAVSSHLKLQHYQETWHSDS